jgi:hypothetical protein
MSVLGRLLRWAGVNFVVVVILVVPRPGQADEASANSELEIQRGIELRKQGKDREAIDAFERAYALDPTPRAGAQVALAHQAIGDWLVAEHGLETALGAGDDPWIAQYRPALEQALATAREHLGWLRVLVNVTQGELLLNGALKSALPVSEPLRVVAGTLEMEARASGYTSVRRTVDIEPGVQTDLAISLDLASPPLPPPAEAATIPRERVPAPRSASRAIVGYVVLSGAGLLASAGVAAWRVRESNVAVYNDDSRCRVGPLTRAEQCGRRAQAANLALGVEIGALAAAGVTAALGAWLLWAPRPQSSRNASVFCGPGAGLGALCVGRF